MNSPTIAKERIIAAPPERLFAALTMPDHIVAIFPFAEVEIEQRPGGVVMFRGESEGLPFTDSGVVEVWQPPQVFQYRYWSDNHGTERLPENEVVLRYEIERLPGGASRLQVTHSALPSVQYAAMMDMAWDLLLETLASRLEAGSQ